MRSSNSSNNKMRMQLSDPNYKGSKCNVVIEWENGKITSEPLSIIGADDPVTSANYARHNNLLDEPGWARFKRLVKREKKLIRLGKQAKLRSCRTSPRCKFRCKLPLHSRYENTVKLDNKNGDSKWQDAIRSEIEQQQEYETCKDLGKDGAPPADYKKIRAHFVFDAKHDGRHKARLAADSNLVEAPLSSVYSGAASLRGIRLVLFLAELNGLESWGTDAGNTYLEAKIKEKVCIIVGPEFGDLEGHVLIMQKALYGLRTSGFRWHERLADCLRYAGFFPCKMEPGIWMKKVEDNSPPHYEHIAVYVDDLLIASKTPQAIVDLLTNDYKFKLKGTGPIKYHLGCDFARDELSTLCFAPRKHIEKMSEAYFP